MKKVNVLVSICGAMICANSALADDKATFTLHMPILETYNSSETAKPSGQSSAKSTKSVTRTAFLDSAWLAAAVGKVNLYIYPHADLKLVSSSYMITDSFELGLDFGANSMSLNKPKNSEDSSLMGVFAFHYLTLKNKTVIESSIVIDSTTAKKTETTSADGVSKVTKSNSSTMFTKLMVSAVIPLKDNFSYVGSIWYDMTSTDDKEAKVKTDASGFGLNLVSVRYAF